MSSAGQRDEESNLKSGLGKNEDGGEFDQGFEGKCTKMFVRKTTV